MLEPGSLSSLFRSQGKNYLNYCSFRNFAHKRQIHSFTIDSRRKIEHKVHDNYYGTLLQSDKSTNLLLWIFWNCAESFFSNFFGFLMLWNAEIVIVIVLWLPKKCRATSPANQNLKLSQLVFARTLLFPRSALARLHGIFSAEIWLAHLNFCIRKKRLVLVPW